MPTIEEINPAYAPRYHIETSVARLRNTFERFGYAPYKMSKFETYDLYLHNKSFLVSEQILTFTDHNGKLMALKPDVTLSIVKSAHDATIAQKVYYNEHVYRVPKGDDSFREIMQMGIECVGNITSYNVSEVLCLAVMSLAEFSSAYVLDVSHLGILSAFLDELGVEGQIRKDILHCVSEKNIHGIKELAKVNDLNMTMTEYLCRLVALHGDSQAVEAPLYALVSESGCGYEGFVDLYRHIADVKAVLPQANLHIDFSVVGSMSYYNGIVFRGFVPGVHTRVLSGGQYDLLMARMGKGGGAVGFALYLDQLALLNSERPTYDVDILLVCEAADDATALKVAFEHWQKGERVLVVHAIPKDITAGKIIYLNQKGEELYADESSSNHA